MRRVGPILFLLLMSGTTLRGEDPVRALRMAEDRFEALKGEFGAAVQSWAKRYGDGRDKADPAARYRDWPGWSFAPRFVEFAEASPGHPVAFDALIEVIQLGDNVSEMDRALLPSFERATAALVRDHIQDARFKSVSQRISGSGATPPREKFLRAVLEKAQDREVRAWACFGLARCLAARREAALTPEHKDAFTFISERIDPSYFEYIRGTDPEASYDEARGGYKRAIDEFGDIKITEGRFKTLADAARFLLNKLEKDKLDTGSIGKLAPELEGEDAEGKEFRLSDYRGKVVVLTFSGNWCGPCRSMYPHERELVERLKSKPFALLSVDTDEDRETLKKAIKAGEITWRCWWERGVEGPICLQWGNVRFPNIYVIDPRGIIRHHFEGSPDPPTALDDAVDRLLSESTPPRRP